jgi:hypothetical protein
MHLIAKLESIPPLSRSGSKGPNSAGYTSKPFSIQNRSLQYRVTSKQYDSCSPTFVCNVNIADSTRRSIGFPGLTPQSRTSYATIFLFIASSDQRTLQRKTKESGSDGMQARVTGFAVKTPCSASQLPVVGHSNSSTSFETVRVGRDRSLNLTPKISVGTFMRLLNLPKLLSNVW